MTRLRGLGLEGNEGDHTGILFPHSLLGTGMHISSQLATKQRYSALLLWRLFIGECKVLGSSCWGWGIVA